MEGVYWTEVEGTPSHDPPTLLPSCIFEDGGISHSDSEEGVIITSSTGRGTLLEKIAPSER